MVSFYDLPQDIHETVFGILFDRSDYESVANFSRTSKYFMSVFRDLEQGSFYCGVCDCLKWIYRTELTTDNIIHQIVIENRLDVVKFCIKQNYDIVHSAYNALYEAAECGMYEIFLYLYDESHQSNRYLLSRAIRGGSLDIIKYLYKNSNYLDYETNYAIGNIALMDRRDIIEWICDNITTYDIQLEDALDRAIDGNHFDLAKWLAEKFQTPGVSQESIRSAIKHNRVDILDWLYTTYFKYIHGNFLMYHNYGMKLKHMTLDMVKWLYEKNWIHRNMDSYGMNVNVIERSAARYNKLDIMKWMYDKYGYVDNESHTIVRNAIEGGNLEILIWIQETIPIYKYKVFCRKEYIDIAVEKGRLDIIQWIYENVFTNTNLAINDSFSSRDNWFGSSSIRIAIKKNNLDIIQWIHKKQPNVINLHKQLRIIAKSGHIEIFKWYCELYEQDKKFHPHLKLALIDALIYGNIPIVEFIYNKKSINIDRWIKTIIQKALDRESYETVKWFYRLYRLYPNKKTDVMEIVHKTYIKYKQMDISNRFICYAKKYRMLKNLFKELSSKQNTYEHIGSSR